MPQQVDYILRFQTVATFSIPLVGEFPIPAPEVIASSVISAGVASTVTVAGSIVMQAVVNKIKQIFKKIFTKVLKKEVANVKEKLDNKKGSQSTHTPVMWRLNQLLKFFRVSFNITSYINYITTYICEFRLRIYHIT